MKVWDTIILVLLSVSITGCLVDSSGIAPPGDQIIYPLGLVTTEHDEYLLTMNSNFDLTYNAGTLVAISLDKLDEMIAAGGSEEWLSPDKKFMYVPEAELIDEKDTIRLGAFAGDLKLTPYHEDSSVHQRALVPVRGSAERHILVVDVDESAASGRVLECGQGSDLTCDSAHRVTSNDTVNLPIEPYAVTSLDYERRIIDDSGNGREIVVRNTIGFATHLESGSVSMFQIENSLGELDAKLWDVVSNVVPEASGIASNPVNNEIYVSGRENSEQYLAILQVLAGGHGGTYQNKPYFGVVDKVAYGTDLLGGTDTRGVAVSSSGKDVVMVSRSPEALLRIDTETRKLIDMVTVGAGPAVVDIYEDPMDGDEYDGSVYAFILCFDSNQVYIIEPAMMQVMVVRSTGTGPQAVAFDKERKRVYIANFRESTLSVIQAVPPFDHVRIGSDNAKLMIGKPRLPDSHD